MSAASDVVTKRVSRGPKNGLSIPYRLLVIGYILSIVVFSYREGFTAIGKGAGALVGIGFLLLAMSGSRRITLPTGYKIWLAWFAFAAISAVQANDVTIALNRVLTLVQIVPLAFLITNMIVWNGRSDFFWRGLLFAGGVSIAMVFMNPNNFQGFDGRVFGTLGNANAYGALLVTCVVLGLVEAVRTRSWLLRILMITILAVFVMMAGQTGSRQAIIGVLAGSFFVGMGYVWRLTKTRSMSALGVIGIFAGGIFLVLGYLATTDFWFRMDTAVKAAVTGTTQGADNSIIGRVELYLRGIDAALDNPAFGVGLDNFQTISGSGAGFTLGTYAHSNYVEILATTGFLGFFLYFSMYISWIREIARRIQLLFTSGDFYIVLRAAALVGVLLLLDLTSVSYYQKFHWLIFAGLMADFMLLRRLGGRSG